MSEDCKGLVSATGTGTWSHLRPRTGRVRCWRTTNILLLVIQGKKLVCTFENVKFIASAVRCVSASVLPPHFCLASVSGRSMLDCMYDLGENNPLECIRATVASMFDIYTLLYRLLVPLRAFIEKEKEDGRVDKLVKLQAFEIPSLGKRRRLPSVEEAMNVWVSSL